MRLHLFLITALLIFTACGEQKKPEVKIVSTKPPDYGFAYHPYDNIAVTDRDLYNMAFNIIRNKLIFYVVNSLPSYGDPLGMACELGEKIHSSRFEEVMKNPVYRAWNLYQADVIPLPDEDIKLFNAGESSPDILNLPKALFTIRQQGETAIVMVRYWVVNQNYNAVYTFSKDPVWRTVKTEEPR